MIPHILQLKNFLSYGPEIQTIDFSNYHLICLTGKNGHGKSALLDAITWAIWGQARKSSGNAKADAGLIHLGQNHMMVILEFEVNGNEYRIRREYVQTKSKPFTSLDFGIKQLDGKLIALTDKTIKETQEKIEKTLGISYESFINSTFLRQGQSNEFSKKLPKERKEILAQILQLQQFEEQKKIALCYAKKLNQDYLAKQSIQQRIEHELQELQELPIKYHAINEQITQTTQTLQGIIKQQTTLNEKKQMFFEHLKEQELLIKQHQQLIAQQQNTQKQIDAIAQIWHENHKKLNIYGNKATLEQKAQTLQIQLQIMQENYHKKLQLKDLYLTAKEQLSTLTQSIEKTFQTKKQELNLLAMQQEERHKQTQRLIEQEERNLHTINQELTDQSQQINHFQKTLCALEKEIIDAQNLETNFEKNKTMYQELCTQGTYLKQHVSKIQQQLNDELLACPLCQQNLNTQQQLFVHTKLQTDAQSSQNELIIIKEQAIQVKDTLNKQQPIIVSLKNKHEQFTGLSIQIQEQKKQIDKLLLQKKAFEQNIQQLLLDKKNIEQEQNTIESTSNFIQETYQQAIQDKNIQTLQNTCATIETTAKQIIFNQTEYQNLEQQHTILKQQLIMNQEPTEFIQQQTDRKAELFELFKRAQLIQNQLENITATLHPKTQQISTQEEINQEELSVLKQKKDIDAQHQTLLIEKSLLEQKQKRHITLSDELHQLAINSKTIHSEMLDYQEIAKALGKDGIQALLIEQAIPEIEHETNIILSRLTNNQTQIFIESLRDLKKGGSKETLDIKISDQFGLRDYELFSGGETFRIDFALRIGISKLLARRAGTTLQTIFIDEGFGSQDEEGLQLIMDNLHKIQNDFAKIIIVSHLTEMKEQFPVQFIVEKKRSGSTVSVFLQE